MRTARSGDLKAGSVRTAARLTVPAPKTTQFIAVRLLVLKLQSAASPGARLGLAALSFVLGVGLLVARRDHLKAVLRTRLLPSQATQAAGPIARSDRRR